MSSTLREASKDTLQVNDKTWHYYSLPLAEKQLGEISRLPKSLKVLMENLLRWQDGDSVTEEDIRALAGWLQQAHADREIAYRPARVLMQDFTGVPAVVDLAAMREAVKRLGGDTAKVNPLSPVDLVIDHSVTVDRFGDDEAFEDNVRLEMERNHERYAFLRWGQQAFQPLQRGAAGHRYLPSGEPGIPRPGGLERGGERPVDGVAGYAGGHRLPYHHD